MPRQAAIARLIVNRRELAQSAIEQGEHSEETIQVLDRLILDVRAGRVDAFELRHPGRSRVTVSAD